MTLVSSLRTDSLHAAANPSRAPRTHEGKLETPQRWLLIQNRAQALLEVDSVLIPAAVREAWSRRGCETSRSRTAGGPPLSVAAGNL